MRSDELKNLDELQLSERGWLKEIAVQLAKLNESKDVSVIATLPQVDVPVVSVTPEKRGPGRPKKQ